MRWSINFFWCVCNKPVHLRCLDYTNIDLFTPVRFNRVMLDAVGDDFGDQRLLDRLLVIRIQNIVLDHEEDVKDHADRPQTELHQVAFQPRPFVYASQQRPTLTQHKAVHEELQDGQQASREVQQHVVDRPADTAVKQPREQIQDMLTSCGS